MYSKPVVVPMRSKRNGLDGHAYEGRVQDKARSAARAAARQAKREAAQVAQEAAWHASMARGHHVRGHRASRHVQAGDGA